jgi:hypothetical protein
MKRIGNRIDKKYNGCDSYRIKKIIHIESTYLMIEMDSKETDVNISRCLFMSKHRNDIKLKLI